MGQAGNLGMAPGGHSPTQLPASGDARGGQQTAQRPQDTPCALEENLDPDSSMSPQGCPGHGNPQAMLSPEASGPFTTSCMKTVPARIGPRLGHENSRFYKLSKLLLVILPLLFHEYTF